ncbi:MULTISPECIES: phosphocholine-specific phospholipase C [unclassified Variovorax]|uniref:phosphocholine-specific phospholipase C n=1 Tax=unclassified Variovorax TaxID=663243 RepID=UPI003F445480
MNSRRRFITGTATTSAAALALSAFPPAIRRALAIPANNITGTIQDVEHIVILMQENRSFDHYFGTLMGVRGFGDRFTIPLPKGLTVWQQSDAKGDERLPHHLDSRKGNAQRGEGNNHAWNDGQNAWDGGRIVQWPKFKDVEKEGKTPTSMAYFKEAEVPFQFALANAFTLCDGYHCSMHTGTNSNRLFHWTGTNGPTGAGVASVNNEWSVIEGSANGYEWKTYPERLQEAKVSWIVYQNMPDNFTDNPLVGFRQYRRANEASGKPVSSTPNTTSPAYDPASDDVGNPLYKGIANTMPDGGFLEQFRQDIKNGKLPQVSWIIAPEAYSEHPDKSSPVQGGWYIQETLDALTAVPEVWSKTVLLVNFDENDGYFDHCPSPAAPSLNLDGTMAGKTTLPDADLAVERFTHPKPPGSISQPGPDGRVYGPGMRVPMYIVSPWSRGGWVNSQVFDHTSVLRFIEARFGVKETNISPFRRAVCGDLTSAFNFATPNNEALPTLAGRMSKGDAEKLRKDQEALKQVALPVDQQFPRQATGTRPSRALPYELHVSGRCDALSGQMRLVFKNTGKAAAVFHVYDKLHLERLPRRYMVEPGKTLDDAWAAATDDFGLYDLWVLGPNGFHRHFMGNLEALRTSAANPEVRVCYDIANGNVHLQMLNSGERGCKFTIRAVAYRVDGPWEASVAGGATAEQLWALSTSGQWYDFDVTCDADPVYYRRFAGRVETGRHSVSDPAMGMTEPA